MKPYKDLDNNSKIESYEYDENHIKILFKNGDERDYRKKSISFYEFDCLKARADQGQGLDEYIKEIQ